jgi:gas vesicle protein
MNIKKVLKVALGTGLFLLDQPDEAKKQARQRVNDQVDDLRERAQDTYQVAADRVGRAADVLRGEDDHRSLWNAVRLIAGIGIGIGVGLLIAPANGDQTRTMLAEKAQEFGDNVRQRFAASDLRPTGTGD